MPNPKPPLGIRLAISAIIRSGGIPCNQTCPGPCNVVINKPSPPNIALVIPGTICTSYETVDSKQTRLPEVTRNASPSSSCLDIMVPPPLISTSVSPDSFCNINPCPPKKPAVNDFVNSISICMFGLLAIYAPF